MRGFAINCNHFPSVPRLATARTWRGSPTQYIFGPIERYLRNYVKIGFHIFRQIERRGQNCIEVRLIEQEDAKQRQYWQFINGPHFLRLINYYLPKNTNNIWQIAEKTVWFYFWSCLFTSVLILQPRSLPEILNWKERKLLNEEKVKEKE